ncbi:hypothetical protein [Shinella sp.]|uniref:hypothetical protein n=1 Tax=Shinella sp. TaxID=1870904 RepID=UPI003D2DA818
MSTNTKAISDDTMLIEEAIIAQFGERCPDFDPDCHCCRVWRALDDLRAERAAGAKAIHDAVMAERARIVALLLEEAELTPCGEDAMVTRSNAFLIKADFSYEEAERLSEEAEG